MRLFLSCKEKQCENKGGDHADQQETVAIVLVTGEADNHHDKEQDTEQDTTRAYRAVAAPDLGVIRYGYIMVVDLPGCVTLSFQVFVNVVFGKACIELFLNIFFDIHVVVRFGRNIIYGSPAVQIC
jgi:hypothetical protein